MMKSCAKETTPGHMASAVCAVSVVTVLAMVLTVSMLTNTLTLECELSLHHITIMTHHQRWLSGIKPKSIFKKPN